MKDIISFVNDVSADIPVIFPVHPRKKRCFEKFGKQFTKYVRLVEPLGYFDMLWLLRNSTLAFTDSGGLQKEAYWLKVPCITLRDETEWVETVQRGWNIFYRDIKANTRRLMRIVLFTATGRHPKEL